IPNSELATRRVNKPEEVVQVGDHVEVKILDIRPEERRMTLSLRQAQGNKDRRQYQEYQRGQREDRVTIGDMVGDVLEPEEEFEEEEEYARQPSRGGAAAARPERERPPFGAYARLPNRPPNRPSPRAAGYRIHRDFARKSSLRTRNGETCESAKECTREPQMLG